MSGIYMKVLSLKDHLFSMKLKSEQSRAYRMIILVKRLDMEREKRPISRQRFVDPTELTNNEKYVKVDLEKLINKVYLSPAAPSYLKEVVESIISKYGLGKEIIKSDLYTLK
jgi:hypothetical protein